MRAVVLSLVLAALLAACGYKGPLYVPKPKPEPQRSAAPAPAQQPTPDAAPSQ